MNQPIRARETGPRDTLCNRSAPPAPVTQSLQVCCAREAPEKTGKPGSHDQVCRSRDPEEADVLSTVVSGCNTDLQQHDPNIDLLAKSAEFTTSRSCAGRVLLLVAGDTTGAATYQ